MSRSKLKVMKLFILIFLLSVVSVSSANLFHCSVTFANENTLVKVNSASGSIGEEVKVDITISQGSNVCIGNSFNIIYDNEKLELVSSKFGEIIKNAMPAINENYKPNMAKLTFLTLKPINEAGIIVSLNFKIKVETGRADVNVTNIDFRDYDKKPVLVLVENGAVEIVKKTVIDEVEPKQTGEEQQGSAGSTATPLEGNISTRTTNKANDGVVSVSNFTGVNDIESTKFTDISEYSWAKDEINFLTNKGIIKGISGSSFGPGLKIKRADLVVLMVRMLGLTGEINSNFSDVSNDKYYYKEVGLAKDLGYITGFGDNKSGPEEYITRQDLFVIVHRIMIEKQLIDSDALSDNSVSVGMRGSNLNQFNDKSLIADYAKTTFETFVSIGLVKGNDGRLNPLQNATRAETAVFIYRIHEFVFSK